MFLPKFEDNFCKIEFLLAEFEEYSCQNTTLRQKKSLLWQKQPLSVVILAEMFRDSRYNEELGQFSANSHPTQSESVQEHIVHE